MSVLRMRRAGAHMRLGEQTRQPLGYLPVTNTYSGMGASGSAVQAQSITITQSGYISRQSSAPPAGGDPTGRPRQQQLV